MRDLQTVQIQGFDIKYSVRGSGAPLIFLHNGGSSHRIWDSQIKYFEKHYQVFAPDFPGYGESDKHNKPYPHALYLKFLEGFIEHFNLKEVTLVGHCLGSSIAYNYALKHNTRVSALVLFNILTDKTLTAGELQSVVKLGGFLPALVKGISWSSPIIHFPRWMRKLFVTMQLQHPTDVTPELLNHLQELYRDTRQLRSLNQILLDLASFAIPEQSQAGAKLPPMMMLWSQHNKVLPLSSGLELAEQLSPDRFEVIPDTGHLCMCERPDQVNDLLNDFLRNESATESVATLANQTAV